MFDCQSQLYGLIGVELEYSITKYENYLIESKVLKSAEASSYRALLIEMYSLDFNNQPEMSFTEALSMLAENKELPTKSQLNQCSKSILKDTLHYDHATIIKVKRLTDSIASLSEFDYSTNVSNIINHLSDEYLLSPFNKLQTFYKLSEVSILKAFELLNNDADNAILINDYDVLILILNDSEYYMNAEVLKLKELTKNLKSYYSNTSKVKNIKIEILQTVSKISSVILMNKLKKQRKEILEEQSLSDYGKSFETLNKSQKNLISKKVTSLTFIEN